MDPVENFFTWTSLGTLVGASAAVVIVTNTVRLAFKLYHVWVPLAVSIILSFVGAAEADALTGLTGYVLAVLNACLLFCTALGVHETIVPPPDGQRGINREQAAPSWRGSWVRS